MSSERGSQARPWMCSSASLCTQAKLRTGCKSLGWRRLCPALYSLHQANPIPKDVMSWVLCPAGHLCFFYHAGNVSITLMRLVLAKRSKTSLLRQTCLSPGETSHLVSPSHSSVLHVLVNPNKFGYVRLFMGKNKMWLKRGSKHLFF